jgi:hypothetical protein
VLRGLLSSSVYCFVCFGYFVRLCMLSLCMTLFDLGMTTEHSVTDILHNLDTMYNVIMCYVLI